MNETVADYLMKETNMGAADIYSKSQLGVEELVERRMRIPSRVRTMLVLVDGTVPVIVLKEEAQKVGAASDFLEQLQALGLIVKTGSLAPGTSGGQAHIDDEFTRFRRAQDFMNASVVNALGIKSFFYTLRLERASNLADLREMVDSYKTAITKASGPAEAEVLTRRLMGILGD